MIQNLLAIGKIIKLTE